MESFEPWLSRIEKMERMCVDLAERFLQSGTGRVDDWEKLYDIDWRRRVVRELIEAFRVSPRRPFPGGGNRLKLKPFNPQGTRGTRVRTQWLIGDSSVFPAAVCGRTR